MDSNYHYFSEIEHSENYEKGNNDAFDLEPCEPPQVEPERTEYLEGYAEGIDDWNQFAYPYNS